MNCLNVFDHFVELALKGLKFTIIIILKLTSLQSIPYKNIQYKTAK